MPSKLPPRKDKNRVPRDKRAIAPAKKDAERVAKVIARAGLGSRREIEDWIVAGRVAVNGVILESPANTVTPEDAIEVDGQPLPERERTRLFLYHKPKGVVTTNRDPEGRTTLFEILPGGLPRLVSIGRLDLNSEGLLLLTNDGGLARALELPETGWLRRYRVRAKGEIDQSQLDALLQGITVEGIEYGPIEATLDRVQGANVWITVALREGKNREVRNVLSALGMQVNRLIRVSYGPFQLGEIGENDIEEVRTRILRDQIGLEIAAASGADFDGPLVERTLEEAPARPVRPIEDEDAPRRPARGPRRPEREPEGRARARHPAGPEEETQAFRIKSRRADPEREVESRGTVADRKGREIKVERVVALPRDEESPARRSGPGLSKGRPSPGRPGQGRSSDRDDERRPARSGGPGKRPASGPRRLEGGFEERPRSHKPAGAPGRSFEGRGERRDDRPAPSRFSDDARGRRARPQGDEREDFRRSGARSDTRPRSRDDRGEGFRPRGREDGGREDRRRDGARPPRREDGGREGFRPRPQREDGFRPKGREDSAGGREDSRPPRREDGAREGFRPRRDDRSEGQREDRRGRSGPRPASTGPKGGGKHRGERGGDVGFVDRGPREPRGDGPPRGRSGPGGKGGFRSDAPRSERPRSDRPRSDGPRSERPRSDGPRGDGPRSKRPRADRPYTGDFKAGGPKGSGPKGGGPKAGTRTERPKPGGFKSGPKGGGAKRSGPPRGKPSGPRTRG